MVELKTSQNIFFSTTAITIYNCIKLEINTFHVMVILSLTTLGRTVRRTVGIWCKYQNRHASRHAILRPQGSGMSRHTCIDCADHFFTPHKDPHFRNKSRIIGENSKIRTKIKNLKTEIKFWLLQRESSINKTTTARHPETLWVCYCFGFSARAPLSSTNERRVRRFWFAWREFQTENSKRQTHLVFLVFLVFLWLCNTP